ncbi:hypothetical protein ACM66B_003483 [Microbotryomycetes sp. NB124-2]
MVSVDDAETAHIVAQCVLDTYARLPANGKPARRSNGAAQWTVLAGICILNTSREADTAHCIAIGTGLKALPHAKLPRQGDVLHDSHAEVIARRGLLLWLYDQLERHANSEHNGTSFLERTERGSFRLQSGSCLAMYISTLPCGDASTWSLAQADEARRSNEIVTPSERKQGNVCDTAAQTLGMSTARDDHKMATTTPPNSLVQRGRSDYSSMSNLRTKPGRLDSLPTTSHSCSDKILLWQLVGLQGALLSSLGVEPLFLDCLVIGGVDVDDRDKVEGEVRRAVQSRAADAWPHAARVLFTNAVFQDSREAVAERCRVTVQDVVSCQESLSFIQGRGSEVIVNGIRQGASSKRKQGEPLSHRSRSRMCKLSLFERHFALTARGLFDGGLNGSTYFAVKQSAREYVERKRRLRSSPGGSLAGWLVSGAAFEQFDWSGAVVEEAG